MAGLVLGGAVPAAAQVAPRPQVPALTLGAAIAEAMERSPELQPRHDAVRSAAINARLAASDFGIKFTPTISAGTDPSSGATRNASLAVTKKLGTGAQVFANLTSYEYGGTALHERDTGYTVGLSQPLLRGFQQTATAALVSARRMAEAAERDRETAREALVVRVTQQYFEVVKQQRLKAASEKAADRAARMQQASEARTRVGLATELDVLRARMLVAQTAASVAATDGALATAVDQLALSLGRDLGTGFALTVDPSPLAEESTPLPDTVDELVALALGTRLEITEAEARVADATRNAMVAKWNTLPPLAFEASYTQRGIGAPGGGLNSLLGGWRVGLSSSYSLNRAAEVSAFESASIAELAAVRSAHEVAQRVTAEVRQVHRQWRTASTSLAIQDQAVALAERELELATLRYERGLGSSLDVVSAEANLLQAENARIGAELDRRVFSLDLRRVVGQLDPGSITP